MPFVGHGNAPFVSWQVKDGGSSGGGCSGARAVAASVAVVVVVIGNPLVA